MLKAVKRKGWAANRAKIPLMDLLCWHIAYKRRKNDSNKASCKIWDNSCLLLGDASHMKQRHL